MSRSHVEHGKHRHSRKHYERSTSVAKESVHPKRSFLRNLLFLREHKGAKSSRMGERSKKARNANSLSIHESSDHPAAYDRSALLKREVDLDASVRKLDKQSLRFLSGDDHVTCLDSLSSCNTRSAAFRIGIAGSRVALNRWMTAKVSWITVMENGEIYFLTDRLQRRKPTMKTTRSIKGQNVTYARSMGHYHLFSRTFERSTKPSHLDRGTTFRSLKDRA